MIDLYCWQFRPFARRLEEVADTATDTFQVTRAPWPHKTSIIFDGLVILCHVV